MFDNGLLTRVRHGCLKKPAAVAAARTNIKIELSGGCWGRPDVVPVYHLGNSQVCKCLSRLSTCHLLAAALHSLPACIHVRKVSVMVRLGYDALAVYARGHCNVKCVYPCAQVLSFVPVSPTLSRKAKTAFGLFFGRYGLPLPHAAQIVSVVGAPIPGAPLPQSRFQRWALGRLLAAGCLEAGMSCCLTQPRSPNVNGAPVPGARCALIRVYSGSLGFCVPHPAQIVSVWARPSSVRMRL